jgi:hypothetical protein
MIRLLKLRLLEPPPHRHVANTQCRRGFLDRTVFQKRNDNLVRLARVYAALHRISFANANLCRILLLVPPAGVMNVINTVSTVKGDLHK